MSIRVMICGKRRRGKDTLADCIQRLRPKVQRAAFADAVKREAATAVYEWETEQGNRCETWDSLFAESLRQRNIYGSLWQFIGEYRRRYYDQEYWIRRLHEDIQCLRNVVITDCRYPNEVDYGHKHGFTVVRVNGPCRDDDGRSDNHPSESQVDELEVDLEFANVGTTAAMEQWVSDVLLPFEKKRI